MATQTESPRAVPIKTVAVEVQVNLENKVSVATQTVQLDDDARNRTANERAAKRK